MKFTYDPQVDALKISWGDYDTYASSDEADHPDLILDCDTAGHVIGAELLNAKTHLEILTPDADRELLPAHTEAVAA